MQTWLLNNAAPVVIPAARANPVAVADKFSARMKSIEERASLRAFEGAPPVVPHPVLDINVQTCRACHAMGLKAGDKTARMVSHTYLVNCTQCHVEKPIDSTNDVAPANSFVALRASGYGGTRAWAGAPPVMPHTVFMRTNCVACHGEHGYDGWRPDHLSRTNCMQCHVPAAEFEQLAPTFGMPDVPDGAGSPATPSTAGE
jgi:cytochrome c-type protein NapB